MPLPTFIICGERRCGTTSLYTWMRAHPEVFLYPKADMDYFIEDEIARTREWVDGEADTIRVLGFVTERQYFADEQYRRAGFEPQLRRFRGDIPMGDAWVND